MRCLKQLFVSHSSRLSCPLCVWTGSTLQVPPRIFWFRCQSSHFRAAPLTAGRPVFQLCLTMIGLCMLINDMSESGRVIWCLGISLMFGNRSLCRMRPVTSSDWLRSGKKNTALNRLKVWTSSDQIAACVPCEIIWSCRCVGVKEEKR